MSRQRLYSAARVGHHRHPRAVGQVLRVRVDGVRRPEPAQRDARRRPRRTRQLRRTRWRGRRCGGDTFLQQELGRSHVRVGVEARDHHVVAQEVGGRQQRHALVVRHERPDHDAFRCTGASNAVDGVRALARGVVHGFVVSEPAFGTCCGQPDEVAQRGLWADCQCERRRIRRDHEVVGQAALESESGHAERLVLVVVGAIAHVVRRLRDAPWDLSLSPIAHLTGDGTVAGRVEQRLRERPHQQRRHQVLEHRRAPRQQRRHAIDADGAAPEMEPVALRDVSARDGDEARQPRLGGQQVVERVVEHARSISIGKPVADREEMTSPVVEEPEVHLVCERAASPGQFQQCRTLVAAGA